jgi:nucleoside diphosphate kinase
MAEQLTYVMVSPYSIYKSRTGGIISRLIARTGLDLAAARLFAPGEELVREYAATIRTEGLPPKAVRVLELIREYLLTQLVPDPKTGQRRRALMLLFRGEDAVAKVAKVAGTVAFEARIGETLRDSYGDLIVGTDGKIAHFEPAVLAPLDEKEAVEDLRIWAKHSDRDGGLLEGVVQHPAGSKDVQRTFVLLKPDNFKYASGRPGNIIDMFSSTGLYIVAFKVHRMSVAQALEFYGPVREVLVKKAAESVGGRAKAALEKEFGFPLPDDALARVAAGLAEPQADFHFGQIVQFMTGRDPKTCSAAEKKAPGLEKCIALVYEGPDAVRKIRGVLGPTDPRKAPPGTVRRELGTDIMVNAAHASDSPENAAREMKIVNPGENTFKAVVEEMLGKV